MVLVVDLLHGSVDYEIASSSLNYSIDCLDLLHSLTPCEQLCYVRSPITLFGSIRTAYIDVFYTRGGVKNTCLQSFPPND